MIKQRTVIVGLGLMGGSLALALRPHLHHLTVVDNDLETLDAARGWADTVADDLAQGIQGGELIILATPVRTIISQLVGLSRGAPDNSLILDLGSTKMEVCRAMEMLPPSVQAIGGHPMCGKETAGFSAAVPDLYRNQTFVLCRTDRTDEEVENIALQIIDLIGARPLFLAADVHDTLVAATSHLPYLAAALLIRSVTATQDERLWQVSASGFRDTTRLAGSDPAMFLDILMTNRVAILAHLKKYQLETARLATVLQTGDETALAEWLARVQDLFHTYRRRDGHS